MFNNPFIISGIFSIISIIITYFTYNKEDSDVWISIKTGVLTFIGVLVSLFICNPNVLNISKEVIKTSAPPF